MQVGIIGLGKMGSRIAKKLHQTGHDVIVWNRSKDDVLNLQKHTKVKSKDTLSGLVKSLKKPRVAWVMLPHMAFDEIFEHLEKHLEKNDILIDGGNSYFKETEERFGKCKKLGIRFLGIGVSGGVHGEKNGYSLMAGGDRLAFDHVEPLLKALSSRFGSYDYFGSGGAGHFVKMVHNGIEYGMMQSIGEGFEVLKKSPYKLDLSKIAKVFQRGTIISGFLIDRTADIFEKDQNLKDVVGEIAATGEAEWMVNEAKRQGTDVEIIKKSLDFRKRSKIDQKIKNSFTAKVVASLRNAFGGHEVKKK